MARQTIWFGARAVDYVAGATPNTGTGQQLDLLDDAADFGTLLIKGTEQDQSSIAYQQLLAFTGTADQQAALGIDLADGVVDAPDAAGAATTAMGDLRVGEGVVAHNLADVFGGSRTSNISGLATGNDPVAVTGHGRLSAGALADAITTGQGSGNYVTFSNALGFGLLGGAGWDPGGNASRLNDGESITFTLATGRLLAEASFTVRVLNGGSTTVVLDSDGRTIRDGNGAAPGGLVQDASAGELSIAAVADGTRIRILFDAGQVLVGDTAVDATAFLAAFAEAGADALTLGSAVGNAIGWSADNLILETRDPGDVVVNRPPDAWDDSCDVAPGGADVTAALLANDSDPEAQPLEIVAVGTASSGTVALGGGAVVYTADAALYAALGDGQTLQASFAYTVRDAGGLTDSAIATVTLTGVNDAATISGSATGTVRKGGVMVATGDLDVADVDSGEDVFALPASLAGLYGSFTFDTATGSWRYELDATAAAVQALGIGESRTETLAVASFDGTANRTISITIRGPSEDGAAVSLAEIAAGDSTLGFKIIGEANEDLAGYAARGVGDIDGDGRDDVAIGAYNNSTDGSIHNGAVYVVFGKADGMAVDLDDIAPGDSTLGYKIIGEASSDYAGFSVGAAGDMNGDGRPDVVLGAHQNGSDGSPDNGAAYVVFGKADGGTLDLDDIATGSSVLGFKILGESGIDQAGWGVGGGGDVNGDGRPDVVVAAIYHTGDGRDYNGAAYVVFGKADGGTVDLDDVAGGASTLGFKILGEAAYDYIAYNTGLAIAGDMNGDGLADLAVGAAYHDSHGDRDSGAVYVVFGKEDGAAVDLVDVAAGGGTLGFKILGEAADDYAGIAVDGAGDVNGDGLADLVIGAYGNSGGGRSENGAAYVVFGKADGDAVELAEIASGSSTLGFKILGEADNLTAAWSVAAAGDVNGDGLGDLLVGAHYAAGSVGAAYIVFGQTDGGTIDLAEIAGGNIAAGVKIVGEPEGAYAGYAVSAAGDVNGDGRADVLVTAHYNGSDGSTLNGAAYIVFGQADWAL